MDKQLIERIVTESVTALKWDLDAAEKADMVELVTRCLARIDAERGKEAVGKLVDEGFKQIEWINKPPVGSLLFLSPTVPEGMALVPIEPTDAMRYSGEQALEITKWETGFAKVLDVYRAMLAAAQGERK